MKNFKIIPEYPSYQILDYTNCEVCPKNRPKEEEVYIEHFPAEYKGGKDTLKIMFVGESPGKHEQKVQRPFIGRSGQLLRQALVSLKYVTTDPPHIRILFTNTVKCRCIGAPDMQTVNACIGSLAREVDLFLPHLIIGLGKTSFHALTGLGYEHFLGENRKKHFSYRGIPVRVTYHPAAALRHINYKISLYQDLKEYLRLAMEIPVGWCE